MRKSAFIFSGLLLFAAGLAFASPRKVLSFVPNPSVTCVSAAFYKDDPSNRPDIYKITTPISTARPGQVVVVYAAWKNTGNTWLRGVKERQTVAGFPYVVKDSNRNCHRVAPNVFNCNFVSPAPPRSSSGGAIRIRVPISTRAGLVLTQNALAIANYGAIRNACAPATLTIVSP